MELWQLRYFVRVAETRSIAQASAHLHIAAPAISRSIKSLEDELKARLFERDGRGMHLTWAGELLLDRATGLLRDAELVKQAVAEAGSRLEGEITVGATPSFIAMTGLALMHRCAELHPLVRPRVVEGYSVYLEDWVRTGAVELAIVNGPIPNEGRLSATLLGAERLFVIGRPDRWPFGVAPHESAPLAAVLRQPLLLPSHRNRIRAVLDRAADEQGLRVEPLHEVDSVGLIKDLVLDGIGAAVLPYGAALREIEAGQLRATPVTQPELRSDIHLIHQIERPPGPVATAVIGIVRDVLAEFATASVAPVLF